MRMKLWTTATLVLFAAFVSGCGQAGTTPTVSKSTPTTATPASKAEPNDGWWCTEHGVPEGICAQCNSKVAADLKKKGDWCKEHDRPESQCFICHPELEAKFAAQYQAKYGKKAPKPAE